jgi:HlyD family secretion protein
MKSWITKSIIAVAVFGLAGCQKENQKLFRTADVKRDTLLVTISATGTVEPEEVIDVGAQVSGKILSFGKDAAGKQVDYGSMVESGMVLATIDDTVYQTDIAQGSAQLDQAKAGVVRSQAELALAKAKLDQASRDWERAKKLGPSDALSESAYDGYRSAYETAVASVGVSEASLVQSKANVAQAEAQLQRAQRNLGYCTITSPVRGVVIDRRVNVGQTVASGLNTPSLFLIAKDLKRMQIWVAVNEADIGSIRPDQPVTFTVDARPGENFRGTVGKVRLNASMSQNVVTYTVEIVTDNADGRLLPYLTANIRFEIDRRPDVLLVPNAALRYAPRAELIAQECRTALAGMAEKSAGKGAGKPSGKPAGKDARPDSAKAGRPDSGKMGAKPEKNRAMLWVNKADGLHPLPVIYGESDGILTEVEGEGIADGMEIVLGEEIVSKTADSGTTNPFMPKMPGRRGGPGGGAGGAGGARPAGGGGGPPH